MPQVLQGITILDFTRGMPGAIATMVCSDFGAAVIKVEPPGGDPFRAFPGALQWDRGKKSVILDLKEAQGPDIIPIPGAKSRKHLQENVKAVDLKLTDDDLARLNAIMKPGAAAGPRLPEEQMARVNL